MARHEEGKECWRSSLGVIGRKITKLYQAHTIRSSGWTYNSDGVSRDWMDRRENLSAILAMG